MLVWDREICSRCYHEQVTILISWKKGRFLEYRHQNKVTTYQIEVAFCISKWLRKYFSIIKMYHYRYNSFHIVFTITYVFPHYDENSLEWPHNLNTCGIIDINVCLVYLLIEISYHTDNPSNVLTSHNNLSDPRLNKSHAYGWMKSHYWNTCSNKGIIFIADFLCKKGFEIHFSALWKQTSNKETTFVDYRND